jgi:hypothetical protein
VAAVSQASNGTWSWTEYSDVYLDVDDDDEA